MVGSLSLPQGGEHLWVFYTARSPLSFLNSKDPDWHDRLGKEGVFDKLGRWFKGDKK